MSNSEHNGKHFVIQKGKAICDKGTSFPNFKVTSHEKHYWNDDKGEADYLAVTEDDVQFNPIAIPFGNCSMKNGQPCSFAAVGKWQKPYDKVKVMDKSCLTENSELQCAIGGKIKVMNHGQTTEPTKENFKKADPELLSHIIPFFDFRELVDDLEMKDFEDQSFKEDLQKISKVGLFMTNDTPINEGVILKHNQTIKVKIHTQNMPNELLKISLYEGNQEEGADKNNKIDEVVKAINEKGFLWCEFKLPLDFSKITDAMINNKQEELHEYYVLVECETPNEIEKIILKGKFQKQMGFDPIPKTGRTVSIVQEIKKPIEETILNADCIVQFRPQSNWKGEFGFDWFRVGDTSLDGDTNYETLIGQYYTKVITDPTTTRNSDVNSWTEFFELDPQPTAFASYNKLEALKNLYGNYSYSLENDTSGSPIKKRYYRPFITLFPRKVDPANPKKNIENGLADLQLYLEFKKVNGKEVKPDRIIFEIDGKLADNSHTLISISKHSIDKKDLSKKIELTITCKSKFATDKDINVFAIMLDESGKEKSRQSAGILKIIAPEKQLQKDVVIVRVRTSAGNGRYAGIKEFKRNLRQALILPNIIEKVKTVKGSSEDITLDVRKSTDNYNSIDFNSEFGVTGKNIVNEDGNSINLQNYLKAELERKYPNQFTNHFKLFFLDNVNDYVEEKDDEGNVIRKSSTLGYSNRNTDFGIMFGNHDDSTIGHECLHGLGLPHSFYGSDYIYQALKTDNVMDYSHLEVDKVTKQKSKVLDRVSTWYWQWKKVNSNIN